MRPINIIPDFVGSADGSCLIETGGTRVICTASIAAGVPKWRERMALGWVTAEYAMLPASTGSRKGRATLRPDGRGVEIQRLIGRVLRSVVRMDRLGAHTVHLDCDVLEADGGTRTASINGAYVALARAVNIAVADGRFSKGVLNCAVSAVSVGIVNERVLLDLDYSEDSTAQVDMNIAMTSTGKFVEVQGAAEQAPFDYQQLETMLRLGKKGAKKMLRAQREAIAARVK